MVATVTLKIPDEIYQRLELNAKATQRSIEIKAPFWVSLQIQRLDQFLSSRRRKR